MKSNEVIVYFIFPLFVSGAVFGLFMLDHETKRFVDLLTPRNLSAFVVYAVPTYFTSILIYQRMFKNQTQLIRILAAASLGSLIGFTLIMSILLANL